MNKKTTNNKQQTTNNKQQTTNNKQQSNTNQKILFVLMDMLYQKNFLIKKELTERCDCNEKTLYRFFKNNFNISFREFCKKVNEIGHNK